MSGDYRTAQRLANVTAPLDGIGVLPFESYSGYITTNDTTNSNIFFWFFPATVSLHSPHILVSFQGADFFRFEYWLEARE